MCNVQELINAIDYINSVHSYEANNKPFEFNLIQKTDSLVYLETSNFDKSVTLEFDFYSDELEINCAQSYLFQIALMLIGDIQFNSPAYDISNTFNIFNDDIQFYDFIYNTLEIVLSNQFTIYTESITSYDFVESTLRDEQMLIFNKIAFDDLPVNDKVVTLLSMINNQWT